MPTWPLDRRTTEATILAVLSIVAVGCLRFPVEPIGWFGAEMAAIVLLAIAVAANVFDRRLLSIALSIAPVVIAMIARVAGAPIAYEMTMMTTLGAGSLGMAIGSSPSAVTRSKSTRSMSLVASGFLTLFAVTISDHSLAVLIAMAWMTVCVWHLVANHWERLDLCAVDEVRRGWQVRPVSVIAAIGLCILTGLVVRDRFGDSRRFAFGFMPTSGGTKWSDPAALSGVGSGDAAIAAKDHAESFGAVESDLFLESTESTLFDMFSDSIGEPKKKNKWERRQGMTSDRVLEAHAESAKSDKGGSSFSTDRMPAEKHLHLNDRIENAVVQWAGPTGIRLAMNRYDTFDGVDWSNQATHRDEKLIRREHDGVAWFFDPMFLNRLGTSTEVNLLKVLRLDSTRLPVPMMTSGLHIKDVDRQDFFGIDDDGSFFMPGRDQVPQFTVINVAHANVLEDELLDGLWCGEEFQTVAMDGKLDRKLEAYVTRWTDGMDDPYAKLQAIVSHLRTEFTFDRGATFTSDDPLAEFLDSNRGGDHLFATAAALMARKVGLQSRLTTGFYVRPGGLDIGTGHTNVVPEDVHVWAEIKLRDGRWIEIEPTPGYQPPVYTPSMWLIARRTVISYWPHAIAAMVISCLIFATRLFWFEIGLSLLYPIGALVWPRRRMTLAMRVIQARAKLAGCPRAVGRPQRDWLLSLTATEEKRRESVRRFCDAADRAAFAGSDNAFDDQSLSKELLMQLRIKTIRQLATEVPR